MMRHLERSVYLKSFSRVVAFLLALATCAMAQQFDAKLYSGMQWRLIGPFRAGRVTAVAGIPGDITTYYMR